MHVPKQRQNHLCFREGTSTVGTLAAAHQAAETLHAPSSLLFNKPAYAHYVPIEVLSSLCKLTYFILKLTLNDAERGAKSHEEGDSLPTPAAFQGNKPPARPPGQPAPGRLNPAWGRLQAKSAAAPGSRYRPPGTRGPCRCSSLLSNSGLPLRSAPAV